MSEPVSPPKSRPLAFAFTVELQLTNKLITPLTTRGVAYGQVTIKKGRFSGPRISGEVIPGGGDFPEVRADGIPAFEAVYFLREKDGTLIRLVNHGLRVAPPEQEAAFAEGRMVEGGSYKLHTFPTFDVEPGKHEWLAHNVFVGLGQRTPDGNRIDYYKVL
jgi:hypothetical protein